MPKPKIKIIGKPRRHPSTGTIFVKYQFDYMDKPDEMTFHRTTTTEEIKFQLESSYYIMQEGEADLEELEEWEKDK